MEFVSRVTAPFLALPHVWKASRVAFVGLSFILLIQGLVAPVSTLMLGYTVEVYVAGAFDQELLLIVGLWACLFFATIIAFPASFVLGGRINEDFTTYLTGLLLDRGVSLQTLELFDDTATHDLMSIVAREAKSRAVNYTVLYSYIVRAVISVIAFGWILGGVAWYLPFLLICGLIPLHFAYTGLREANWKGLRQRTAEARYLDYLSGIFLSRDLVLESRCLGMRAGVEERFRATRRSMLAGLRHERIVAFVRILPVLCLGTVLYAISMVIFLRSVESVALAVAGVTAAVQSFIAMQHAVSEVVENIAFLREKAFFFRDLNRLLALEETSLPKASRDGDEGAHRGEPDAVIEFSDVTFRYPGASGDTLSSVSFRVRRGEVVALVGKNGSGKSTIVKLACGFYGPNSGVVRGNGAPLTRESVEEWRDQISPIFQDTHAFAFSLGDNVSLSGTEETGRREAALARAYGDARPCDDDERLGVEFGGVDLSGGELQRLGLARAYWRERDIVIMDEPTSAIDPVFERATSEAIRQFVEGRTALIVTHRMPQALAADRVIVVDGGRIVEDGAPGDLAAAGGLFADMLEAQASGYRAQERA